MGTFSCIVLNVLLSISTCLLEIDKLLFKIVGHFWKSHGCEMIFHYDFSLHFSVKSYWPFVFPFLWSIYSHPLPIFYWIVFFWVIFRKLCFFSEIFILYANLCQFYILFDVTFTFKPDTVSFCNFHFSFIVCLICYFVLNLCCMWNSNYQSFPGDVKEHFEFFLILRSIK